MKLKLAQRLLIGYYKNKLKAIAIVSPRKAAEAAFAIFCTPFDNKPPKQSPPVFHKAEKLSFEINGITIRGFRWTTEKTGAKKILIVHGFRSYAYKFEKYALALKKEGFEILAFDAPAHGTSDGKKINAYIYKSMLDRIESLYGPFYGVMGHSLGGLAASLTFESLADRESRKLVLIAPAETERALKNFFMVIPVDEKVKKAFTELINEFTGKPISYYSVGRVVKGLSSPVLWVHDKNDNICPFEDVKPLLSLSLPHVKFMITDELGHNKIYKDNKVCAEIVRYFAKGIS
ncbi:MAG: alpha/beta fold hydrolase [Sediminibacterium sp.]